MSKGQRFGKYGNSRRREKVRELKSMPLSGRDIIRRAEHFKIAPKHPGMGRR